MSLHIDPTLWKLKTAKGIPYKLMEGHPTGKVTREGYEVTEQIIIRRSDLNEFIEESYGGITVNGSGDLEITQPRACPGAPGLYVSSIDFGPFPDSMLTDLAGTETSKAYTDFLVLTLSYQPFPTGSSVEDWAEISVSPTSYNYNNPMIARSMCRPGYTDPNDVQMDFTLPVPGLEWSVRFLRLSQSAWNTMLSVGRTLQGFLNNSAMPALGNAPAETILFAGFQMDTNIGWGPRTMRVELKFQEIRVPAADGGTGGWNHYWFEPGTGWHRPTSRKTGAGLIPTANLNLLFSFF